MPAPACLNSIPGTVPRWVFGREDLPDRVAGLELGWFEHMDITWTYERYLEGYFRKTFELIGTPLAIEFRTGRNPYVRKSKR